MWVKIKPKMKRAKDRVASHGDVMLLMKADVFRNEKSILVQSKGNTFHGGQKWLGWLKESEAEWEPVIQ
jgi:hypothetical protein